MLQLAVLRARLREIKGWMEGWGNKQTNKTKQNKKNTSCWYAKKNLTSSSSATASKIPTEREQLLFVVTSIAVTEKK